MLGSMDRHALHGLAALALAGCVAALGSAAPVRAATPIESGPAPAAPASEIVPGAVHRGSIRMSATYAVAAHLTLKRPAAGRQGHDHRPQRLGRRRGPRPAQHRDGPARAPVLRDVTVDGVGVTPRLADQTITVPLGGVLPAGATAVIVVQFRATLRSTTSGSTWLFTRANGVTSMYRWVPGSAGPPGSTGPTSATRS